MIMTSSLKSDARRKMMKMMMTLGREVIAEGYVIKILHNLLKILYVIKLGQLNCWRYRVHNSYQRFQIFKVFLTILKAKFFASICRSQYCRFAILYKNISIGLKVKIWQFFKASAVVLLIYIVHISLNDMYATLQRIHSLFILMNDGFVVRRERKRHHSSDSEDEEERRKESRRKGWYSVVM